MIRKIGTFGIVLLLASFLRAELRYNFSYFFYGAASSKMLIFIPFRVYSEAAASIDFIATRDLAGDMHFTYAGIGQTGYYLRTVDFSGKAAVILTADYDYQQCLAFSRQKLAEWTRQVPEYSHRIKRTSQLPHLITTCRGQAFVFDRDASGVHNNPASNIDLRYKWGAHTLYFNIFPIAAEFLRFYNHPFAPDKDLTRWRHFPAEWSSDWLDYSGILNRFAGNLEKIIKQLVSIEQKEKFRLIYRVTAASDDRIEICGECRAPIRIWKQFMLNRMVRRVSVRVSDGLTLEDEILLSIRNQKGQGGYGRMLLRLVDS